MALLKRTDNHLVEIGRLWVFVIVLLMCYILYRVELGVINMITVHIRKQGGAAVITIPSDVLKMLSIGVGTVLALDVTKEGFTAHAVQKTSRKRYS